MVGAGSEEITNLLHRWRSGDPAALEALMSLVYDELRSLAGRQMRRERGILTLQPTALVHEVYLRLIGANGIELHDRAHFFAFAVRLMRRVLVDEARRRAFRKRGGDVTRVAFDDTMAAPAGRTADAEAVDEALERLAKVAPRKARVVELRFFGGLTIEETAEAMGVSLDVVKREWRTAKLWMTRLLEERADELHPLERG